MIKIKAHILVLEALVSKLIAESARHQFGPDTPAKLARLRKHLWSELEHAEFRDADKLTEIGRVKARAEMQLAFNQIFAAAEKIATQKPDWIRE